MVDQAKTEVPPGDELARIRNKGEVPIVVKATSRDRGIGPFKRLALRSATVIDGTGAPPIGPIDIIVENGRIVGLNKVTGYGAAPSEPAEHEIDCRGKWVTPGFVDCHAHAGVAYHVSPSFTVELAYRYLDLGDGLTGDLRTFDGTNNIVNPTTFRSLTSHDLKLGVRWNIDATPPVYAPPPIRKG